MNNKDFGGKKGEFFRSIDFFARLFFFRPENLLFRYWSDGHQRLAVNLTEPSLRGPIHQTK
jgi:hypothetical protein